MRIKLDIAIDSTPLLKNKNKKLSTRYHNFKSAYTAHFKTLREIYITWFKKKTSSVYDCTVADVEYICNNSRPLVVVMLRCCARRRDGVRARLRWRHRLALQTHRHNETIDVFYIKNFISIYMRNWDLISFTLQNLQRQLSLYIYHLLYTNYYINWAPSFFPWGKAAGAWRSTPNPI